jgi:hypothetical protein
MKVRVHVECVRTWVCMCVYMCMCVCVCTHARKCLRAVVVVVDWIGGVWSVVRVRERERLRVRRYTSAKFVSA